MDVRDRLFLGPIDKYRKHDRFPWQMVLALTLAVLTSMNVIVIVSEFTNYSYSQLMVFNRLFLNLNVTLGRLRAAIQPLRRLFIFLISRRC